MACLFLNGSIDFSTPAHNTGEQLVLAYSRAAHSVVSEMGHEVMVRLQPAASDQVLSGFFQTGQAKGSAYTYQSLELSTLHTAADCSQAAGSCTDCSDGSGCNGLARGGALTRRAVKRVAGNRLVWYLKRKKE